jgi:hypothetical protein
VSEPRWWLESLDPDDAAAHDGPVADLDEPPYDAAGHEPRLQGEPTRGE